MADAFTTTLNLTKPEDGASRDAWGVKLNANMDAIDAAITADRANILSRAKGAEEIEGQIVTAATVNLAGVDSRLVLISGSANVSSFGSGAGTQNKLKLVRSANAFTLVHSANLILPGAANIAVAAGDSFLAYSDNTNPGTVWRVVGYQRADGKALSSPTPVDPMVVDQVILKKVNSTTIGLFPSGKGNKVFAIVNGLPTHITVPDAGLTVTNTGGAGYLWYIYVYMNGATPTLFKSTTAPVRHATYGHMVCGGVGNEYLSFVGRAYCNSDTYWYDEPRIRFICSHFQKRLKSLRGEYSGGGAAASLAEFGGLQRAYFITDPEDEVQMGYAGKFVSSTYQNGSIYVTLDQGAQSTESLGGVWWQASDNQFTSDEMSVTVGEGQHFISVYATGYGATMYWYGRCFGYMRG